MTAERDILSMVPMHTERVTAVASLGCYANILPEELPYRNWCFPTNQEDVNFAMYEVVEKIAGNEEDYPYICVLGFRTFYSIN